MGSSFDCELRLTSINQDVTRTLLPLCATMAPACARPASPETTLPGPSSPPSLDVPATRVSWSVWDRRTPTSVTRPSPEGYPHPEVPRRARNHHQLGRHGEDLAPHLLQRAPRCPRGAARPPDRGPPQPQGQQGEDDPDHVRDLQQARHVRRHPGCALPVRLWPYHRYRHGLR